MRSLTAAEINAIRHSSEYLMNRYIAYQAASVVSPTVLREWLYISLGLMVSIDKQLQAGSEAQITTAIGDFIVNCYSW